MNAVEIASFELEVTLTSWNGNGNIKNVSTILFKMYHSPSVLCLSSCVFCRFRDDLGTIQKLEIKPHQRAPLPNCVMNTLECLLGRIWKSIWTSNQKVVGSTPIRSTQIFFLSNLCHWLNSPLSRVSRSVLAVCMQDVCCIYIHSLVA